MVPAASLRVSGGTQACRRQHVLSPSRQRKSLNGRTDGYTGEHNKHGREGEACFGVQPVRRQLGGSMRQSARPARAHSTRGSEGFYARGVGE